MIIQNPEFLILLPLILYSLLLAARKKGYGRKIATTRTLTILLLILAAASPAITQSQDAATEQKLNILIDNTTSMKVANTPNIPIEGRENTFITGNNSKIFSQAAQNIEKGSENLLITDARTEQTTDKIIQTAEEKNASISVYDLEEKTENSVSIEGPSTTVPGAQNEFHVEISSTTKESIPVQIKLDGETIYQGRINETYNFTKEFESEGEHTIQANITSSDIFSENNQYYKTVKVEEKPDILTIGSSGSLEQNLEQFYNIETSQTVPDNIEDYYAVIMKKPVQSPQLETYLAEGNGLVYTGPIDQTTPDYLPVQKSNENEEDAGAKIMLLIDASFGTGECIEGTESFCLERSSSGGNAKESIRIAYSLVDSLKQNNKVGAIAYNKNSYLISEPQSLASNRDRLKQKISRIDPDGPSFHDRGLNAVAQRVESNDTVVMLTDGKIGDFERKRNVPRELRNTAPEMAAKLITIGVGEEPNEPLLQDIAETTGGYYLQNNEAGRLNFEFGSGGGGTEYTPVAVVNPNHFITKGLELEGTTTNFKNVKTRRSASKLAAGSNGNELLSTWRYGLGRVAAFSAGDEDMERLSTSDPALISKTVSWTVGNPQRNKDNWLNIQDASKPEKPVAEASYQIDGLNRKSENLYTAEISTNKLGFNEWNGESYAYNYNSEKQEVGQNLDKLQEIPQKTGGIIYNSQNIGQISERLENIDREVEEQVSLSPYLLSIALLIFLIEIGFRKRNGRL